MSAGELRQRVTFQERAVGQDDGFGNVLEDFADRFTVWARLRPRLGGEQVMAGRLAGRQPYTITVRHSTDTAQVTTDWRARDAAGALYNIRSVTNPDERRQYLEMLAETGVQT